MENGKGTARETELLAATDVAGMIGVKETTVYKWCKEGKLPCLKVGKYWRIRREALEDFLMRSERPRTLVGQLDSFLRVPDNVLAIAQNVDILHRLDAAFFNWVRPVDLNSALEQQERLTELVDTRNLVVKTAALEEAIDEWPASQLSRVQRTQRTHSAIILASEEGLSLSRATPMPLS